VELTVLGCSGSFGAPASGPCSGYLLRSGPTTLWLDCGNGSFANLQRHVAPADLTGVVVTHLHPDHCVDLYGLHVFARYGLERSGIPVYGPSGLAGAMGGLVNEWGDTFEWHEVGDGDRAALGGLELAFSRTDHPPPTVALEVRGDGRRLVYTSDTGPGWSVDAFERRADLVLSEATYQHAHRPSGLHLSARQAGEAARGALARRLVITHLWPTLDPLVSAEEAADAFGAHVTLAAPHMVTTI